MISTVQKWGNSMAVRLPKALVQATALEQGTRVTIEVKEGRIVVTPVRTPAYRLEELVRGITRRNWHRAVETGSPRGREAW